MTSDTELLERFAGTGDAEAFRVLVERHGPMVRGVALRCTGDEALSDEVTQTVFAVLARRAATIRHANLAGWLHNAAFLISQNARNKAARYQRALQSFTDHMKVSGTENDDAWEEMRPHVDVALSRLRPNDRDLLVRHYFEGRSVREIASVTGHSEDASRKRLQRSVIRLREILRKRGVLASPAALAGILAGQNLCSPPASASALATAALREASVLPSATLSTYTLHAMNAASTAKTAVVVLLLAAIPMALLWRENQALKKQLDQKSVAQIAHSSAKTASATGSGSSVSTQRPDENKADGAATPVERFSAALRCPDRIERMRRFLAALEEKTAENSDEFNEAWRVYRAEGRTDFELASYYFTRDGELRGAKGLAIHTGRPVDFRSISTMGDYLAGAMKTDPQGVRAWFDSLTNESYREKVFGGYVTALANQDLPGAMEVLAKIDASFQPQAARAIVNSLQQKGGLQEVAQWVRTTANAPENADPPWLSKAFDEAMRQTTSVHYGTRIAAELLEEFAGRSFARPQHLASVAGKYAAFQPVAALQWALRMEEKSSQIHTDSGAILAATISGVTKQEIQSVEEWCHNRPAGAERDLLLAALAKRAGPKAGAVEQ